MSQAVLEVPNTSDQAYPISLKNEDEDFFNKYAGKLSANSPPALLREYALRKERYDAYMDWLIEQDGLDWEARFGH